MRKNPVCASMGSELVQKDPKTNVNSGLGLWRSRGPERFADHLRKESLCWPSRRASVAACCSLKQSIDTLTLPWWTKIPTQDWVLPWRRQGISPRHSRLTSCLKRGALGLSIAWSGCHEAMKPGVGARKALSETRRSIGTPSVAYNPHPFGGRRSDGPPGTCQGSCASTSTFRQVRD